jgi:DNA-binding MarR family transcriptional regulator
MSLVRRDRPSSDRRTVRISLTAEGRRWVERKRRQLARRRRRLFESLSLEERRHAEPLLRHLADLIGEL